LQVDPVDPALPIWVYIVVGVAVGCCLLFAIAFIVTKLRNSKDDSQEKGTTMQSTSSSAEYAAMPDFASARDTEYAVVNATQATSDVIHSSTRNLISKTPHNNNNNNNNKQTTNKQQSHYSSIAQAEPNQASHYDDIDTDAHHYASLADADNTPAAHYL
jgi:hypothetical protein